MTRFDAGYTLMLWIITIGVVVLGLLYARESQGLTYLIGLGFGWVLCDLVVSRPKRAKGAP